MSPLQSHAISKQNHPSIVHNIGVVVHMEIYERHLFSSSGP